MAQILAPFACAVVVFIAFYALGLAVGLVCLILIGLTNLLGIVGAAEFFEDVIKNVPEFFFLVDDAYPVGGAVVAGIVWIIITCIVEMWLADTN